MNTTKMSGNDWVLAVCLGVIATVIVMSTVYIIYLDEVMLWATSSR